MFGTNGGKFFNANSAHPFENPTPFSNFLQMLSIFAVVGVGHNVELGLNLKGLGYPGDQHAMPTPTVKWKFYDGKSNGWSAIAGDDLFIPVQNRTYDAGNYVYVELARTWKSGTRATFGGYHFTRNVVASGHAQAGSLRSSSR